MNINNFLLTLTVMVKGMFGIFAVTGVIIISMLLLNFFTQKCSYTKKIKSQD